MIINQKGMRNGKMISIKSFRISNILLIITVLFLAHICLRTEVLLLILNSTWPRLELMTSRSWQYISFHWDAIKTTYQSMNFSLFIFLYIGTPQNNFIRGNAWDPGSIPRRYTGQHLSEKLSAAPDICYLLVDLEGKVTPWSTWKWPVISLQPSLNCTSKLIYKDLFIKQYWSSKSC